MKKTFSYFLRTAMLIAFLFSGSTVLQAQHLKKDGTPDMRYKENKTSYRAPSPTTPKSIYKPASTNTQVQPSTAKQTPAPVHVSSGVRTGCICNDGSRSYATGRGACSHHGGVDHWLYE